MSLRFKQFFHLPVHLYSAKYHGWFGGKRVYLTVLSIQIDPFASELMLCTFHRLFVIELMLLSQQPKSLLNQNEHIK